MTNIYTFVRNRCDFSAEIVRAEEFNDSDIECLVIPGVGNW